VAWLLHCNLTMTAGLFSPRLFASLGLALSFSACTLNQVGSGGGPGGDGPQRIESDDPEVDERLDDLGIICETTLNLMGTFTEGMAQPAEYHGCWPVGTWAFSAEVDFQGCDPQPSVDATWVYSVERVEDVDRVSFVADPGAERVNLKISTAGDGLCHGQFDHFGEDNVVHTFRATLQEDGSITGFGAYSVYSEDPF
jgi:hypothetical protein